MSALDKSLEDIIKEKREASQSEQTGRTGTRGGRGASGGKGRGRGSGRVGGPVRRTENAKNLLRRNRTTAAPYTVNTRPRGGFAARGGGSGGQAVGSGAKIHVSGLDPGWTSNDVKELFGDQGFSVTKCFIHWDRSGRSLGKADVEFNNIGTARAAQQDMDGAVVDGYVVSVTLGANGAPSARGQPQQRSGSYTGQGVRVRGAGFRSNFGSVRTGSTSLRGKGNGRGGKGRGGNFRRGKRSAPTQADLDNQLNTYNQNDL